MGKIDVYNLDRNEIFNLIKEAVNGCIAKDADDIDHDYNCNVKIQDVSSVLKLGFLPKSVRFKILENRELTEKEIALFTSDCCVNGLDGVSISSLDLDFSKMYKDECWYNPARGVLANIVISKDIRAGHVTDHYYNEFVVYGGINPKDFKAIDVRILRLLDYYTRENDEVAIGAMITQYNSLIDIATTIKELGISIPLRESSKWEIFEVMDGKFMDRILESVDGIVDLDVDKVANLPKMNVKHRVFKTQ